MSEKQLSWWESMSHRRWLLVAVHWSLIFWCETWNAWKMKKTQKTTAKWSSSTFIDVVVYKRTKKSKVSYHRVSYNGFKPGRHGCWINIWRNHRQVLKIAKKRSHELSVSLQLYFLTFISHFTNSIYFIKS